jgi:para-aminobenzoate synthetase component 1
VSKLTNDAQTADTQQVVCRLHYRQIPTEVNLAGLTEVFAARSFPSILGGNDSPTQANRFSYWAAEPKQVFVFRAGQAEPFDRLRQVLGRYRLDERDCGRLPRGMFCGGWVGYFSYELGRFIEQLPEQAVDDLKLPIIRLCLYDKVICYDRLDKCCILLALQIPGETESQQHKLADLEHLLDESKMVTVTQPKAWNPEKVDFSAVRANISEQYYLDAVHKIKRYIRDGDVYQVNFSQRFESDYRAAPISLYHWQNQYNPSPFAAYIDAGDFAIVSASPEMFVTVRDGLIQTKPIKGTRPRIVGAAELVNSRNFAELRDSEKDMAELNMIIDLERNDLGRVCEYGTIKVVQPRTIETYPTVYHAVATVEGRLRQKLGLCEVLQGMFPGGSITGAPKIHSMEIIDELEPTQRSVYTGSIGYLGLDGSICLNIAIRTVIIKADKTFVQTGGGIVADSDAHSEWDETLTKARALLAGIYAVRAQGRAECNRPRTRLTAIAAGRLQQPNCDKACSATDVRKSVPKR